MTKDFSGGFWSSNYTKMKNIFKFVFSAFFITGVIVFGTLFCGIINEGLVKLFGTVIHVSNQVYENYLSFFKICGLIMLLTFPTAIIKLFANALANPREKGIIWCIITFTIIFVALPAVLLIVDGNYYSLGIFITVLILSLIIGGNSEYKLPFENFANW